MQDALVEKVSSKQAESLTEDKVSNWLKAKAS